MKFTGFLRAPSFNLARYQSELQRVLGEAIAKAAFEWLGVVTAEVPVWSGASHATLLPLASAIGFQLSIVPSGTAPNRIDLGLSNATGEVIASADTGEFTFTYTTTLEHLIFNEFNNANLLLRPDGTPYFHLIKPGPYHFQDKGQAAFRALARDVELPDPSKFITTKSIRV